MEEYNCNPEIYNCNPEIYQTELSDKDIKNIVNYLNAERKKDLSNKTFHFLSNAL